MILIIITVVFHFPFKIPAVIVVIGPYYYVLLILATLTVILFHKRSLFNVMGTKN